MDLFTILSTPDQHFKHPTMKDWLIVKDNYIVYEDDPNTRVLLSVTQIQADNWESDINPLDLEIAGVSKDIDRAIAERVSDRLVDSLVRARDALIRAREGQISQAGKRTTSPRSSPTLQKVGSKGRKVSRDDDPDYEE